METGKTTDEKIPFNEPEFNFEGTCTYFFCHNFQIRNHFFQINSKTREKIQLIRHPTLILQYFKLIFYVASFCLTKYT